MESQRLLGVAMCTVGQIVVKPCAPFKKFKRQNPRFLKMITFGRIHLVREKFSRFIASSLFNSKEAFFKKWNIFQEEYRTIN